MTEFVIEGKYPDYDLFVDGAPEGSASDLRSLFTSVMHRFERGDTLRWDKPELAWSKGQRVTTATGNVAGVVLEDAGVGEAIEVEWDADADGGPYEDEVSPGVLRAEAAK